MLLLTVNSVQAQDSTKNSLTGEDVALIENENLVRFDLLDFEGFTLHGPSDTVRIYLAIPADWQLIEGVEVQLDIVAFISNGRFATDDGVYGGGILIEFNDELLDSVEIVRNGAQTITLPVPAAALESRRVDGRFPLDITLIGDMICDFEHDINVVIQPTSRFILPNEKTTPITDLTKLPRPIYQRSFLPDEVTVVVPTEPTAGELQAALTVAAGFGKMGSSKLTLFLTPVDELASNIRDQMHLIFVGRHEEFEMLEAVTLPPLPIEDVAEDAGVLQTAVSPWNSSKVIIVVSGANDAAIHKAAQAISSGAIRTEVRKDVAIVEKVDPDRVAYAAPQATRSFAELGYSLKLLQGRGTIRTEIEFSIPPGHTLEEGSEAVLSLLFNHSALLDYARSGISIILNDEPVGSIRFSDETSNQGRAEIVLPEGALHTGHNQITLRAELTPLRSCNDLADSAWLTIRPESTLYLPLSPNEKQRINTFALSQYPQPFILDETLGTTAFVLPVDDSVAWNSAAQLALDLGNQVNGVLTNLRVAFADDLSPNIRQNYDLLIVGQATSLPVVMELKDDLPAPFEPGNNRVLDEQLPISYHIPPGVNVGYLQLLQAPWNNEHVIVTVLGDSTVGLQHAQTALLQSSTRGRMASGLAVTDGDDVYVSMMPSNLIPVPETGMNDASPKDEISDSANSEMAEADEATEGTISANDVAEPTESVVPVTLEGDGGASDDVIDIVIEPTSSSLTDTPSTTDDSRPRSEQVGQTALAGENNPNTVASASDRVGPPTPLPNISASNGADTLPTASNMPVWAIPTGIGAALILVVILILRFRRRPVAEAVGE